MVRPDPSTVPPTPRNWGSLFFTVLALVGGLHALLMLGLEGGRALYTRREVTRLEAEISALQAEADTLEAVVAHQDDPAYREQLARTAGFIYSDEDRILTSRP